MLRKSMHRCLSPAARSPTLWRLAPSRLQMYGTYTSPRQQYSVYLYFVRGVVFSTKQYPPRVTGEGRANAVSALKSPMQPNPWTNPRRRNLDSGIRDRLLNIFPAQIQRRLANHLASRNSVSRRRNHQRSGFKALLSKFHRASFVQTCSTNTAHLPAPPSTCGPIVLAHIHPSSIKTAAECVDSLHINSWQTRHPFATGSSSNKSSQEQQ